MSGIPSVDIVSTTSSDLERLYQAPRLSILDINLITTTEFQDGWVSRYTSKFNAKKLTLNEMAASIKTELK